MSEVPDYQSEQLKRQSRGRSKIGRRAWFAKSLALLAPPALAAVYSRYESNWLEVTRTPIGLADIPQGLSLIHI